MPTWLLPIFKSLLGGIMGFVTREKARSEKQRAEGLEKQRESIRRAALEEQKMQAAMRSGANIHNAHDWNKTIEEWNW